ncbi:MAG: hypothetical protein SF053_03695 [Bacteroidia bacterium]|nr:hypothetical protein [Bacteroidia bacterium]
MQPISRIMSVVLLSLILAACTMQPQEKNPDATAAAAACNWTEGSCTHPDSVMQADEVRQLRANFDLVFGAATRDSIVISQETLSAFIGEAEEFRQYFALVNDNLSSLSLITTQVDPSTCSDVLDATNSNVLYWGATTPAAAAQTAQWRNRFGISYCQTSHTIGQYTVTVPMAYTFNTASAQADFLQPEYTEIIAYLGLKADAQANRYTLKLIMQGKGDETSSDYLDFSTPCPIACGQPNTLNNSSNVAEAAH